MDTPARRHLQLVALRAAKALVADSSPAEPTSEQSMPSATAGGEDEALSPARRHRERTQGAVSAALAAANDNEPADEHRPPVTPYDLMLLRLSEDKRRLKAVKSIEKKIELKRLLLPDYAAWCEGVLQAAIETGEAAQDEVVTTIMVWRIDAGDYVGALQLAEHVIRFRVELPARYDRDVYTLLVDEFADAALAAFRASKDFPAGILDDVEILTADADIHDQPRAKLFKARGLEALRLVEHPPEGQAVAGGRQAALSEARVRLSRALELDPRVGVVKEIERLDRELKKESADGASKEGADG